MFKTCIELIINFLLVLTVQYCDSMAIALQIAYLPTHNCNNIDNLVEKRFYNMPTRDRG